MEIESLSNALQQHQTNTTQLQNKYDQLHDRHLRTEAILEKFQQQRSYLENTFSKIREHIDTLDRPNKH